MTAVFGPDIIERSTRRPPVQRERAPGVRHGAPSTTEDASGHARSLLGNTGPGRHGRGNASVRAAMLLQLQQAGGNRAVQRYIHSTRYVQRASPTTAPPVGDDLGRRIQRRAESGTGIGLDGGIRARLETGLGADLSQVRIHTDSEADSMARSVDATAFTSGQDIFFRSGAYDPATPEGMHLLAHEAVHTVQQSQGPVDGTPAPGGVVISHPSDSHEQAATRAADRIAAGLYPRLDATGSAVQAGLVQRVQGQADPATAGTPAGVTVQRGLFSGLGRVLKGVGEAVGGVVKGVGKAVGDMGAALAGRVLSGVNALKSRLSTGAGKLFKKIGSVASRLWGGLKSVGGRLSKGAGRLFNGLKSLGSKVWGKLRRVGHRLFAQVRKLSGTFKTLKARLLRSLRSLGGRLKKSAGGLLGKLRSVGGRILRGIRKAGSSIFGGVSRLFGRLRQVGRRLLAGAKQLWDRLKSIGGRLWDRLKAAGKKLVARLKWLGSKLWKMARLLGRKVKTGLEDVGKWAIDLVRDFPDRLKRLAMVVIRGMAGVTTFLPEALSALLTQGFKGFGEWLWDKLKGGAAWAGTLLSRILDMIGGPELLEFLEHLLSASSTPLTSDEITAGRNILGPDAVRWNEVRVCEGGWLEPVFKRNDNRPFTTFHTINVPEGQRSDLAMIVHELTHVYQYEKVGSVYIGQALHAQATGGYDYGGPEGLQAASESGKHYKDFNREQQAQIAEDYYKIRFKLSMSAPEYEPFISELRAGQL